MCGPLVMTLGMSPHRLNYLLGRALAFSLMGGLAGASGAVISAFLQEVHLSAVLSLLFGTLMIVLSLNSVVPVLTTPSLTFGVGVQKKITELLLQESPGSIFLFGLLTPLLPCGQTVIVMAASALTGSLFLGMLNAALFALLTTPALFIAMHARELLRGLQKWEGLFFAGFALIAGVLALLRGLAELGVIPHLVLNPHWHLVLY